MAKAKATVQGAISLVNAIANKKDYDKFVKTSPAKNNIDKELIIDVNS